MSLLCYFGRHKPSVQSVARGKHGGYAALCEACGVPVERGDRGPWRAADPISAHPDHGSKLPETGVSGGLST
jgi:hypothetical protein